ncbi:MAG: hypothetical protein COA78_23030 [Blastopirellula sp.]|nr:MAG: hypothetical protein COA78_23030 [Blastopirellula sp.]
MVLDHLDSANDLPQARLEQGFEPVEVEFLRRLLRFYQRARDELSLNPENEDSPLPALVAQAIRSRVKVEEICLPRDSRIGPWIETQIDKADNNRRLAEDYLFAAHFSAAKTPLSQLLKLPSGDYTTIQERTQKLEKAFRYRDVLRQSLPGLTQWVAHHPFTATKQEELLEDCLQLAKLVNQLDNDLSLENPDKADAPDDGLLSDIDQHFNNLVRVWDEKAGAIVEGSAAFDNARLLETMNLLRTGTVGKLNAGREPRNYTGLWEILHQGIANDNVTEASPEEVEDLEDKTQNVLLNALSLFKKSPWELFSPGEDGMEDEFYHLNQQPDTSDLNSLNELFLGTRNTIDRSYQELTDLNTTPNGNEDLNHFQRAVRASQALRSGHLSLLRTSTITKFRSNIEERKTAPIYAYEALHKQRMLWQAKRSLNDFWGPIDNSPSTDSYFKRLVASYLAKAKPDRQRAPLPEYESFQDQVLAILSSSWCLNLRPEKLVIDDSSELIEQKTLLQFNDQIPEGISAVELVTFNDELIDQEETLGLENNCHAVPVKDYRSAPPGSATLPQFVQRFQADNHKSSGDLFVRTRYRGHVKKSPVTIINNSLKDIPTRTYTINLPSPVVPTIEVLADDLGKGDVIFILDCSSSMAPDPNKPEKGDRMADAKIALIDVLRSLSAKSNFRVQVVAFGHRIHVGNSIEDIEPVDGYNVPEDVNPNNDVEFLVSKSWTTLVPEGQAKTPLQTDVEAFVSKIKKLNGHGITPLYESIRQALNQITPGNNSHIVAITDGVNTQIRTLDGYGNSTALKLQTTLKMDKTDVKLHIAGFQLPNSKKLPVDERPEVNTVEELGWLAGEGRGQFFNVKQRIALVENIKALVTTNEHFTVTQKDGKQGGENKFNDTWTAKQKVNSRTEFIVKTHQLPEDASLPVELAGGESLRLAYDTQRKLLAFLSEKVEVVKDSSINRKTEEYHAEFIYFNAPKNQGGLLQIPVRIRNNDNTSFSYKPYHIWAEIFAIEGGRKLPDPYIVTDLNFENHKQYPRFLLTLPDWPANAREAKVELYIAMDKELPPLKTFPLDESGKINSPLNNASGKPIFKAGDLILESSGGETNNSDAAYLISVEVRPTANSKSVSPHHLEFKSNQVKPIRIERTYRYDLRDPKIITQVDHRFYFKSEVALKGSSPVLNIWSKTELTQGVPLVDVELNIPQN